MMVTAKTSTKTRKKPKPKITPTSKTATISTSHVLSVFAEVFNAILDDRGVPELHRGRHTWISNTFDVSTSAARKWLNAKCMPDWDNMIQIADEFGVTLDELLGRKPFMPTRKTVLIPLRSSADNAKNTFGTIEFEDGLLESAMRMKHNGLEMFLVSTDQMAPTISEGDIAFLDTDIQKLEDNKIYQFVASNNRVLIRRVILNLDDTIRLISPNPSYQEIKLNLKEVQIGNEANEAAILKLVGEIPWTIHKVVAGSSGGFSTIAHS